MDRSKKEKQNLKAKKEARLNLYEKLDYPETSYQFFKRRKVKVFLNAGDHLTGYIVKEWDNEILLVKSDNLKDTKDRPLEKRMIIPKKAILYIGNFIHLPEND